MKAKNDERRVALEMRIDGYSVPQIAVELGVSKSTAYLWTRHLPLDRTPAEREERQRRHMEHMREARWEPHRRARDADRAATHERLVEWVGEVTDREVLLAGAIAYWCEGAKQKPRTSRPPPVGGPTWSACPRGSSAGRFSSGTSRPPFGGTSGIPTGGA
ncbi:helix-turn-helix domain-containing protein [Actinoplanes sp. CA-030573]|uniref:helix-turn-helix domain-containing protein n=1 Tax=Actinoplanes sp. CA-030573 TaxID=3239898 RepID=UPI003D8A9326